MKFLCLLLCLAPALTKGSSEGIISIQLDTVSVTNFQSRLGHEDLSHINLGSICIGTPCQWFRMMIDTGSSDFWVGSARCEGPTCPLQKNVYYYNRSSTYKEGKSYDKTTVTYGSGSIGIRYSKETANVGGLVVPNQDFGEASAVNKDIIISGVEGIMGLAFKPLAHNYKTPIFDNMVNQQLVASPMFTFCKSRRGTMKDELLIGGTNTSRYDASEMTYVPLIQAVYWKFKLDSIVVLGDNWACPNGCEVVADSGTTLVRGPKDPIYKINYLIGAEYYQNGTYQVPCDVRDLPNVDFIISGKVFTLTQYDYVLSLDGICITGFAEIASTNFIILGGTFLDGLCTVYDKGNLRLGFAKLLR